MSSNLVLNAMEVMPFSDADGGFESRMLIDRESVGSERLHVNHFTLRPGAGTGIGVHEAPYDEVYYVLSGKGLLHLGGKDYDIRKDAIAFIPGGTPHGVDNHSQTEDFVMLTIWPLQPKAGVNPIYDRRKRAWGTSFRLVQTGREDGDGEEDHQ